MDILTPSHSQPSISMVQHNTAGSNQILLSLFSSFSKKNPPVIVAVQEPFLYKNSPLNVPAYSLIFPPVSSEIKVRVCFYLLKSWEATLSYTPLFFNRGDLVGISFTFDKISFNSKFTSLSVYNVYNSHVSRLVRSVSPSDAFPFSQFPSVVMGDFNIHHHLTDPLRSLTNQELALSSPYHDTAAENGYTLLNTPGNLTRHSPTNHRDGVINLTFANKAAAPFVTEWNNSLPATGSDHTAIRTSLTSPNTRTPAPSPRWKDTPWPLLHDFITHLSFPPLDDPDPSDWFDRSLTSLMNPILLLTPKKRPSTWSKAWWTPDISELRRIFHSVSRALRKGTATKGEAKQAKYANFNAIKKAKYSHWNKFTAEADHRQLWAAARLRKPKDQDKLPSFPEADTPTKLNNALINHFFPPRTTEDPPHPRYHDNTPIMTADEVSHALAKSSDKSTPGPDQIPYSTWKKIHGINPELLPSLFTPLIAFGVHPKSLKAANGIVLPKPNKPSYADPSAYRVIVLLETVSKILERIMTVRLHSLASQTGLLNPNQCGSLPGLSVDDAALSLVHDIRTLQAAGNKVSTLFLDIKGGFDNVSALILAARLRAHGIPEYITSWVTSFLSDRSCRLLFKGSPLIHIPVKVGVPQGSPISPLLFVIYVAPLHISIPRGVIFSYVDDLALVAASPSYRSNIRKLQKAWSSIRRAGANIEVAFSVAKTDFIHWRSKKDRSTPSTLPIFINGQLFHPLKEVKWLGLWFTDNLSSHTHYQKRLAKARSMFFLLRTLSPPGSSLTPLNNRRLAQAILLPILLYGAGAFPPDNSALSQIATFWNSVLRWVTNCFSSTNKAILPIEAALLPTDISCWKIRLNLARRISLAPPSQNPASSRMPPTFHMTGPFPNAPSFRHLLKTLKPLPWTSELKNNIKPLPIDLLCVALKKIHPPQQGKSYPLPPTSKKFILEKALRRWEETTSPPPYYQFSPTIKPPLFMSLDRFTAGRFHQVRAHKSYLAAHQSWQDTHSPLCPRCFEEDETLEHAALRCPHREGARDRFIPDLRSLDFVWSSPTNTPLLAAYIQFTRTAYPHKWAGFFPMSATRSSQALSSVDTVSSHTFATLFPI